jgi:hypothetical protein
MSINNNMSINVYNPLVENSHFDYARQGQIKASRSDRGSPSQIGKGNEEDRLNRSVLEDSVSDVGDAIFKDWHGKEDNLFNTIKSCLRDDKLTLQGIEEERNRAGKALDIIKKVNLGLLYIFIFEHRLGLASLQRSKQWNPNAFEDEVEIFIRGIEAANPQDRVKLKTARSQARIAAAADALRLFAESGIQFGELKRM